jgi:hypothetical protein
MESPLYLILPPWPWWCECMLDVQVTKASSYMHIYTQALEQYRCPINEGRREGGVT